LKVDLVAPHYLPVRGGIEDHVAALARYLVAQRQEVTVHVLDRDLAGKRLPARADIDGVKVLRYRPRIRLGYYATEFRPRLEGDVIHLHAASTLTNDWIVRHTRRPVVLSLHHGYRVPPASPVHATYHALHRWLRGAATLRRMGAIVVNTAFDLSALEHAGVDKDRIHVIPAGVGDEAFEPAPPAHPRPDWLGYFLFLGRLHAEKGPRAALEAFSTVDAPMGLVFAGPDQGMRAKLQARAKGMGLGDRVLFQGLVEAQEKRALLAGARALVLPSKHEGFGLALIEAWAQNTPVIAYRVGAVPFVVDDRHNGLLEEYGNVAALGADLRRLAGDPGFAHLLGQRGRAKAENYRQTAQFQRILRLYEALTSGSSITLI